MTGMQWANIDETLFARIVDTILSRIYGGRGFSPEGRGGDQGIDFTVDSNNIIFQYKFYPDGNNTASRRRQIKRSFIEAMRHQPSEWIVVIPAKITQAMRNHITGLGSDVKIAIYDRDWLDNRLIDFPDLAEYFVYRTEIDYIHARGEALKINPILRDSADVADKVRTVKRAVDATDPDWTFDFTTEGGQVIQTLRAKDANSAARSPIEITYTALVPADSDERRRLEMTADYGVVEPIHLSGSMVQDFKIKGPELVAYEGPIDAVELLPHPDSSSPWVDTDLKVTDSASRYLGTHLGRSRTRGRGAKGITIEVQLGDTLSMLFRSPDDNGDDGHVDFTTNDLTGRPIPEVLAVTEFLTQLNQGNNIDFLVAGERLMRITLNGTNDWPDIFEATHAIASDLAVVERETQARFRYPASLTLFDRILIRNARLLLEGNVVAHPTANQLPLTITGGYHESLESLLSTEHGWIKGELSPGDLEILGQIVQVPTLAIGGPARLSDQDIAVVRAAIEAGTVKGMQLTLSLEPDDRLRLWLPERLNREILTISPWGLPGIDQPLGTIAALVGVAENEDPTAQGGSA